MNVMNLTKLHRVYALQTETHSWLMSHIHMYYLLIAQYYIFILYAAGQLVNDGWMDGCCKTNVILNEWTCIRHQWKTPVSLHQMGTLCQFRESAVSTKAISAESHWWQGVDGESIVKLVTSILTVHHVTIFCVNGYFQKEKYTKAN